MQNDNNDFYDRDFEFIPIDDYLNIGKEGKEGKRKKQSLEDKLKQTTDEINTTEDRSFLKEILTDKISFLRQILNEIDEQIKDRETLKDSIFSKIDKGICYIRTKLYEIEPWEKGRNRNIDSRRSQLEKELEALKNQKRDETRESWRDVALLKKEHREFFHEYRNALRRVKVIFKDETYSDIDKNENRN